MAKITQFGRPETRLVSDEALKALQTTAEQFGLAVKHAGGNFTASSAVLKFEFAVKAENGQAVSREAEAFTRCATIYGLKPTDLGRTFCMNGKHFKICGLNRNAVKMPILASALTTGKVFKFGHITVATLLGYKVSPLAMLGGNDGEAAWEARVS